MVEWAALLVGLGFLAMTGTLGYQAFLYLKYGNWTELSVTYACGAYLKWDWCWNPQDWLGVHRVLSWFNVGAFVFLASLVLLWFVASAMENMNK